ncbi:hypothetical protein LF41_2288 [Lysobacter dokdonensis DS-58]|uniref:Secreted protein n=1 Tax=Lysobacter dokdonensis DS-58 TaxID=1300345 RepID=A0A0A2WHX6_9GAMM|nr:hypothetical protein [Lysobacter dokdonensis]KGQ19786.1 hypothetical protein LF41_2288 [Lysobacter dokdonensis DS-58]
MKLFRMAALVAALTFATAAFAADHVSKHGFHVDLPDDWSVADIDAMIARHKAADPNWVPTPDAMTLTDPKIEVYQYQGSREAIIVSKEPEMAPTSLALIKQICDDTRATITATPGAGLPKCEARTIDGVHFMAYQMTLNDKWTLQAALPTADGHTLLVVGGADATTRAAVEAMHERVVQAGIAQFLQARKGAASAK